MSHSLARNDSVLSGGEALDLIYGHLTDSSSSPPPFLPFPSPSYVPVQRPPWAAQFADWSRPVGDWVPSSFNFVVSLQPFQSGGYEVICRSVDLEHVAYRADAPRNDGERVKPDEQDPESVERSQRRSKKKVRYLIKSMGCDRLFTLTRRENDPESYWSRDDWLKAWARFVKSCARAGVDLAYVAVLERHKKGNFHLHVALVGHINIKLARRIWWAITGGRGMGNVDVKYKQHLTDYQRRAGLAKYVSKYLVKGFEEIEEFNKKRYFASRHALPRLRRIILNAQTWHDAVSEVVDHLGLDLHALLNTGGLFRFPDSEGFWFNFTEEIAGACPF